LPKELHPNYFSEPTGDDDKSVFSTFDDYFGLDREFIPIADKFGIETDKFGIER